VSEEERSAGSNTSRCGLVQEFDLAYTIARGTETAGYLDCEYTMTSTAWLATERYWPRIQQVYKEVKQRYGSSFNYSGSGDW
jgi:hypothetical protein